MKTLQKGFTLIELMIVVAIIGILAAIAIPAYQDYTIRAQVSEGLTLASDIKAGVAEYMAQTGDWPVDLVEAGLGSAAALTDKAGRYVESLDVTNGTITIAYGKDVERRRSTAQSCRSSRWSTRTATSCGSAASRDRPTRRTPTRAARGTGTDSDGRHDDLSDKHMPASCRTGFGGRLIAS